MKKADYTEILDGNIIYLGDDNFSINTCADDLEGAIEMYNKVSEVVECTTYDIEKEYGSLMFGILDENFNNIDVSINF